MVNRHLKKWSTALILLLAIALAGCQSVNGYDLNKPILSQMDVTTVEESGSFQLEIDWKEDFVNEMEGRMDSAIALFSKIDLQIQHAKTDGKGLAQVVGSLGLGEREPIGFAIHTDGNNVLLDIEGLKQPLFLELDAWNEFDEMSESELQAIEQIQPHLQQLLKDVAAYFIHHLPNPSNLALSRESVSINGQNLRLTKVHTELDGKELGDLLIQYVDALVKDEKGLRNVVDRVVQWISEISPVLQEQLGAEFGIGEEDGLNAEEGFQGLLEGLKFIQAELAEAKAHPFWTLIFDENSSVTADLYIDSKMMIRKSNFEIVFAPSILQLPDSPINSVTIRSSLERWNINEAIDVPDLIEPANAINPEQMDSLNAVQGLRLFEEDSVLYDLLKNEFQIDDSEFSIFGWFNEERAPFYIDDNLYVSIRDVAEGFENDVAYDPSTGEIVFTDDGTDQDIVLRVDSDVVLVNGTPVELSIPVISRDGYTFIPIADFLPLLGAEYDVYEDDFEDIIITITRDL